jgi:hypothetical protein
VGIKDEAPKTIVAKEVIKGHGVSPRRAWTFGANSFFIAMAGRVAKWVPQEKQTMCMKKAWLRNKTRQECILQQAETETDSRTCRTGGGSRVTHLEECTGDAKTWRNPTQQKTNEHNTDKAGSHPAVSQQHDTIPTQYARNATKGAAEGTEQTVPLLVFRAEVLPVEASLLQSKSKQP